MNWIIMGVLTVLTIVYMIVLYMVAKSKKENKARFIGLLLIPVFVAGMYLIIAEMDWLVSLPLWIYGIFLLERIIQGIALYMSAGKEKAGWFTIIFIIPIIGWIIYFIAGSE